MNLVLYYLTQCPYSRKVRNFVEEHNLDHDIMFREIEQEPDAAQELRKLTGGNQVPCLVINGAPLLESDDIISWLQRNCVDQKVDESDVEDLDREYQFTQKNGPEQNASDLTTQAP